MTFRMSVRMTQQTRLRVTAAATIGCDAIISYVSTRNLADHFGFGWLSWLFPLCLDATAAVGMDLWLSNSPAQRSAKWLALSAVGLSLAANVADWWLATGTWGAAVLGAVPPAMLAWQLLVLHQHQPDRHRRRSRRRATRSAGTPVRAARRVSTGPKPAVPDAELLVQMHRDQQRHGPLSKRRAMSKYRIGDKRARRLLSELPALSPVPVNGKVQS